MTRFPVFPDLPSPRLVVYRERVERNLARMRALLEPVFPGTGLAHLTPHVKTHKSLWATRLLAAAGVSRFKCSPNELAMLLEAGVPDVFVAYPLLAPEAERVARAAAERPGTRVTAQLASLAHAGILAAAARRQGVELDCLLDLDVGMGRTGARVEEAVALARRILGSADLGALRVTGIHAYAGHNHAADPAERARIAAEAMGRVAECAGALERAGIRASRVVLGGTPGFLEELRELTARHRLDARVEASPGTWIYWDTNYDRRLPGMFEFAALILAAVVDRPAPGVATLNAGSKRWGADQGPVDLFSVPGMEVAGTSEEHTVVRLPAGADLAVGEPVFIVPRHVCTTVNLWESFTLAGEDGAVERRDLPVSARNR